ncbi:DUF2332 domain-containing protein [Paenibacillus paeoniae]|uniref:DUF2332 domain-containing protein n=1 Tax=Paenibacillus paeoniae TaxID=2292705 RepID=A0A371P7E9_9BACL|nr:DUF2332 domain-containing protein [Paenibacillus paeoniae]REK71873.1 DUF2332 domain-containing protein [Paenibacillus paeoniae]
MELDVISNDFRRFAKDCKDSSRLYEYLSQRIAQDKELLQLSSQAKEGQPIPNLLFGAVHYLLMQGKSHPLAMYYGSLVAEPGAAEEAFPAFKQFCAQYREEIIPILASKNVQTNEVRRCAYLYPVFCSIYASMQRPLSLIEIGTSAGLQLYWDRYGYSYSSKPGIVFGNPNSELVLVSEMRGKGWPDLSPLSPPVTDRIGIDLHVNDLSDAEDCLWLQALIWPEHAERRTNFDKAASIAKNGGARLVQGNGVKLLSELAEMTDPESVLCVFHTHVANQLSEHDKNELLQTIDQLGGRREVFHIYNNMRDGQLHVDGYRNGVLQEIIVAEIDGHGRWFSR